MTTKQLIKEYISSQPEKKSNELLELHKRTLKLNPGCKLWFSDGKNDAGKIVSNPNIGYGSYNINYANGTMKEFYQVGISANTTGISVYIMGLTDKTFLIRTYGKTIGKASITGYCIKFRSLKDINQNILDAAIKYGLGTAR